MLVSVPDHAVPAGPLAVRWLGYDVPQVRAGARVTARIELMNAGAIDWPSSTDDRGGISLSYHWLDRLDNPIVWEGNRTPLPRRLEPGERIELSARMRGPIPPGPYRLAWDLVAEGRCWFSEIANAPLALDIDVAQRLDEAAISVNIQGGPPEAVARTQRALEAQEFAIVESGDATAFLAAGCEPASDWSRLLANAHQEGYAFVGGSVAVHGGRVRGRQARSVLRPWAPPFGRKPNWSRPLICPSVSSDVLQKIAPWAEPIGALPALDPAAVAEPWLCDGRIRIAVRG